MKFIKQQKGVSIFLAVMILTGILAIALGISTLVFSQLKTTKNIEASIKAIFAADTGIEKCLYDIRRGGGKCLDMQGPLDNGASFAVTVLEGFDCSGSGKSGNLAIKSIGTFGNIQRALCADQKTF